MWSVFVQYVHLPPAVYLPVHVGDQHSLWRCYVSYNTSHHCHGDICSWKDGLMQDKELTHVYENPRAHYFTLLDMLSIKVFCCCCSDQTVDSLVVSNKAQKEVVGVELFAMLNH